jgi:hypothetical protein
MCELLLHIIKFGMSPLESFLEVVSLKYYIFQFVALHCFILFLFLKFLENFIFIILLLDQDVLKFHQVRPRELFRKFESKLLNLAEVALSEVQRIFEGFY